MEGKELLRLLDLVEEFQNKGNRLEKSIPEVDGNIEIKLKAKVEIYKEVEKELEKVLRELNS
jgi:cell fate (sporulation/competence/biofilm development) regulator YlbF (YheA/YmcA/DUF963 family)